MSPLKIGIMGGTFDPIHIGHLVAAEEARVQFGLDRVLFMPAGHPALKSSNITDAEDRWEMTQLAVADNPYFEASRIEVDREGVTYTIDTVLELREQVGTDAEMYFITGADAVFEIIGWKDAKRLAGLVTLIGATRPGYDLDAARQAHHDDEANFDVRYIQVPALAVSSTDLRARLSDGRSIRYLVPDAVADYIKQRGLYGVNSKGDYPHVEQAFADSADTIEVSMTFIEYAEVELAKRITPGAYNHSLGVAAMAQTMGSLYGVDPLTSYVAGLLHDWDRCASSDELVIAAECFGIPITPTLLENPRLLHAHTGAHHVAEHFPGIPAEIVEAVADHTVGKVGMSDLGMVVYIADMIEPSRTWAGVDDLREMVGTVSIEMLFKQAYARTMSFLVAHQKVIHPDTLAVWNSLVRELE